MFFFWFYLNPSYRHLWNGARPNSFLLRIYACSIFFLYFSVKFFWMLSAALCIWSPGPRCLRENSSPLHRCSHMRSQWKKWAISWHCRIAGIKAFLFFLSKKWAMSSNSSPGLRRTSDSAIFGFDVLGYYQWHCFGPLCWVLMPLASWSIFASRKDVDRNRCIEF